MSVSAALVVTGTEVLTGIISDRNGPWVAQQLAALGVETSSITVVGDRPDELRQVLAWARDAGNRLIVTTGGLGPTEDDLTAAVVAGLQERPMMLDEALEGRIWAILEPLSTRWPDLDPVAIRAANRKQALVPEGATVLEPVGTAPGLVVPPPAGRSTATVLVLPGPPRELQAMWPAAIATQAFQDAISGAVLRRESMLRLFGIPESEIAETLRRARAAGVGIDRLEITTCLRRGEIEVVTRSTPDCDADHDRFLQYVRERHHDTLFSDDFSRIDDLLTELLAARTWTIATAESCTGGMLAARLTDRAGASDYVRGGIVVYSNAAKTTLAGVDPGLIATHGAVSCEVAQALAAGARSVLDADVGVGITGVAGPGGGSEEKPVGTVWLCVAGPDGAQLTRHVRIPGARADVRERATTVAMHLLRRLCLGESDPPAA